MSLQSVYVVFLVFAFSYAAEQTPPCSEGSSEFYPDPDCSSFWQCSNGIPYKHSCPAGLQWSVQLNACEWPESAGCDGQGWLPTSSVPETTTTTTAATTTTTTPKPTTTRTTTLKPTTTRTSTTTTTTSTTPKPTTTRTTTTTTPKPTTTRTTKKPTTTTKKPHTTTTTQKPPKPCSWWQWWCKRP